jgi:hypothetical protein
VGPDGRSAAAFRHESTNSISRIGSSGRTVPSDGAFGGVRPLIRSCTGATAYGCRFAISSKATTPKLKIDVARDELSPSNASADPRAIASVSWTWISRSSVEKASQPRCFVQRERAQCRRWEPSASLSQSTRWPVKCSHRSSIPRSNKREHQRRSSSRSWGARPVVMRAADKVEDVKMEQQQLMSRVTRDGSSCSSGNNDLY